ncbi:MAG: cysteine desulfurase family protein [Planctomycetia bacterium]|nr:cysteine desulfurase family protein [Planctomycetia bacterium]
MNTIYLDHNAATGLRPEAMDALIAALRETGNPSSPHHIGRRALRRLEADRAAVARLFHAGTVLFTSGGTEACNLAVRGILRAKCHGKRGKILVSAAEHAAVLEPALDLLDPDAVDVRTIPLRSDGSVDLSTLDAWCDPETNLVAVQWVSHETGVVQPVSEIAAICAERKIPLHSDAVAAVGKLPVGFLPEFAGVTTISISAHKFGGPCGVGALLLRKTPEETPIRPLFHGGPQEFSMRAGTPPVALIAAMRVAIELAFDEQKLLFQKMVRLRDRFEWGIRHGIPSAMVIAANSVRVPYTSAIAFPGWDSRTLVRRFDDVGVCCATGSACSSDSDDPSPVLRAMRLPPEIVNATVRFSFSAALGDDEIDEAVRRIVNVVSR